MASEHLANRAIRGLMLGTLLLSLATWHWPLHEPEGLTLRNLRRNIDGSNLREIIKRRLAVEKENQGRLPPEALSDVHALARYLARAADLNDASFWFSRIDPALDGWPKISTSSKDGEARLTLILDPDDKHKLAPALRAPPLAWAAALLPGISGLPSETPVMWTRGLLSDGTWRADSPYGTSWGGFVVFAGGNLERYHGKVQGLHKWGTYEPTDNIAEALPPGTQISEPIVPPELAQKLARAMKLHRVWTNTLNVAVGVGLLAILASLATSSGRRNWPWIITGAVAVVLAWGFPILADTFS